MSFAVRSAPMQYTGPDAWRHLVEELWCDAGCQSALLSAASRACGYAADSAQVRDVVADVLGDAYAGAGVASNREDLLRELVAEVRRRGDRLRRRDERAAPLDLDAIGATRSDEDRQPDLVDAEDMDAAITNLAQDDPAVLQLLDVYRAGLAQHGRIPRREAVVAAWIDPAWDQLTAHERRARALWVYRQAQQRLRAYAAEARAQLEAAAASAEAQSVVSHGRHHADWATRGRSC